MGRWYRVLVAVMTVAAVLCTVAAGYAGIKLVGAGKQLLSNETLLREIGRWWAENIR